MHFCAALNAEAEPPPGEMAAGAYAAANARMKPDSEYTANDWLPNAAEAAEDAEKHLPSIVKGVLDGAASGDWHR